MTVHLAGSTWAPLGTQTQPRMRAHDIWCLHTMAGSFAGTDSMFHDGGYTGLESHQGVRADGYAEQWQDLLFTADANLDGNDVVISTETEDYGGVFGKWNLNDPSQIPAWTPAQCAKLIATGVQLCLPGTDPRSAHRDCPRDWACYREGIPPFLIPDTRPGRRGIGYHAQGVPGVGLVPGGVQWSNARGKQCPGAKRIAQLKTLVIPGIQAALKPHPATATPDAATAPLPAPQEAPMVIVRKEKGWWYLLTGTKLIGIKAGTDVDPRLPRFGVDEAMWGRLAKAGLEVVL